MVINLYKIVDNLLKFNVYVLGVRLGDDIKNYIVRILFKVIVIGIVYLVVLVVFLIIIVWVFGFVGVEVVSIILGGIGLLIVVGVVVDII